MFLAILPLGFWEGISELGVWVVIIGVTGEGAELLLKWTKKSSFRNMWCRCVRRFLVRVYKTCHKHLLGVETLFFAMVVGGLAVEWLGSHTAMRMGDEANAVLTSQASKALKQAGEANERAALTESNNLVLRSNVVKLEFDAAQIKSNVTRIDPLKQPVFAFSAYAIVVIRPSEPTKDLGDTNLASMPWAPNAALFPMRSVANTRTENQSLEFGNASQIGNGGGSAYIRADSVVKTIALMGKEKLLRYDMYFGGDSDTALPKENRSFQNFPSLKPEDIDALNLVLPISGELIEGRMEISIDNGLIHKSFTIPPQKSFGNSVSSVATNDKFFPINWSAEIRSGFEKSELIRLKKDADEQAFLARGKELEEQAKTKAKDRTITEEQKRLFVELLKDYPKTPIKVFVNVANAESVKYASIIRGLLDAANYGGNGAGIVNYDGDIYTGTNLEKWQPPPATIIFVARPHPEYGWIIPVHDTFYSSKPVISSGLTNDPNSYAVGGLECVKWGFSGIGLNGFYIGNGTNLLKHGEVGIIVPAQAK